jgi:hypothetical protein
VKHSPLTRSLKRKGSPSWKALKLTFPLDCQKLASSDDNDERQDNQSLSCRFSPYYEVASFSSSDTGTGSPWSGAIVFTSSFKRWIFRYKLTLFAW